MSRKRIHLWTKGSPPITHARTSSGLSGVWTTEGRGGKEFSPVREEEAGERAARMVRAGWGSGEGRASVQNGQEEHVYLPDPDTDPAELTLAGGLQLSPAGTSVVSTAKSGFS